MTRVERADRLGHEADAQRRRGSQPHPSAPQTGQFTHLLADRLGLGQHPLRAREQCLAGGDYYAKEGMEAAAQSLKVKIEQALECRLAALEAPSNVLEGVFTVEKRIAEG